MSLLQNDSTGQGYIVYRKEDGQKTIIAYAEDNAEANLILIATIEQAMDHAEYGYEREKKDAADSGDS